MYKEDFIWLEAFNSLRDRELDYSMCCEKTFMNNICAFITGFKFYAFELLKEGKRITLPIFDYLCELILQGESKKHNIRCSYLSWYSIIDLYANSNNEARTVFLSYLDKVNEFVSSGNYEIRDDESEEMHISKMLEAMRPRPGIYLEDVSLELMVKAVEGFCLRNPHSQKLFDGFQVFTEKRYNEPNMHGYKWGRIIRAFSYSDRDALDVFFKLWDKFIQSENKTAGKNKR